MGIYNYIFRCSITCINCLRAKGYKMKRKNTKILSKQDEEKLFHCDKYNYQCCQVRDKVFIIILLMAVAFMIGLNMQEVIEAVSK